MDKFFRLFSGLVTTPMDGAFGRLAVLGGVFLGLELAILSERAADG